MILKFIHPEFEIDFQSEGLKLVEENHWFSDQFFTKYSFPVSFDLTDELDRALGLLSNLNSARSSKKFEGYFLMFGKEHEALFIIERIEGKKVTGKMRYGFEEFPNYDRKLSTLNLFKQDLAEPITDYAAGIITQTWPAVKFNFPQVICDKFDTDSEQWAYYEGAINNYRSGAFLINEYNSGTDEQINRNVMQPMPYLLHVLEQGFADAGYDLQGDILEDPEFKKSIITVVSDYYSTVSADKLEMMLQAKDYISVRSMHKFVSSGYVDIGTYLTTIQIDKPGRYKISGNVFVRCNSSYGYAEFLLNGERFWKVENSNIGTEEKFFSVNEFITVGPEVLTTPLTFQSEQLAYGYIGTDRDPDATIVDVTITRVAVYDANGDLIPALISPDEIDLTKCVPDMTFGELLKRVKLWKNYDIKAGDGFFEMNLIENQMNSGNVVNLEHKEVKYPVREFFEDKSYLLKFQDINSDEYEFAEVFVDSQGDRTSEFVKDENTSEIVIDAIPLPLKQIGTVYTADYFIDDNKKLALVLYDGLTNSLNLTQDPANLLIPAIYDFGYSEWLPFRIHSDGIKWSFQCTEWLAQEIEKDSRIAAYRKMLLIKRLTRSNLKNGLWQIELETEGQD